MITEALLSYIKEEKAEGKDEARIREALMSEGWNEQDLNEGFKAQKSILPFTDFKKSRFSIVISVISVLYVPFFVYNTVRNTFPTELYFVLFTTVAHPVLFVSSLFVLFTKSKVGYKISTYITYLLSLFIGLHLLSFLGLVLLFVLSVKFGGSWW